MPHRSNSASASSHSPRRQPYTPGQNPNVEFASQRGNPWQQCARSAFWPREVSARTLSMLSGIAFWPFERACASSSVNSGLPSLGHVVAGCHRFGERRSGQFIQRAERDLLEPPFTRITIDQPLSRLIIGEISRSRRRGKHDALMPSPSRSSRMRSQSRRAGRFWSCGFAEFHLGNIIAVPGKLEYQMVWHDARWQFSIKKDLAREA
jgi:hypothetical protein